MKFIVPTTAGNIQANGETMLLAIKEALIGGRKLTGPVTLPDGKYPSSSAWGDATGSSDDISFRTEGGGFTGHPGADR